MHLRTLTVIAAICLGLSSVHAQIPKQITYQGVLKDASGVKITGTVDLTFNIYPLGGGDSLYTETHTGVSVGNGLFRVQIGAVTPLTLAFDAPYELGVTADDDAEMIPHTPLCSAPYALNASGVHIDGGNAGDVLTNDGNGTGQAGTASLTIANTPPSLSDATLGPDPAYESDTFECVAGSSSDDDNDAVDNLFSWSVSGSDPGETSASLDNSFFARGDSVTCTITPDDGTDAGSVLIFQDLTGVLKMQDELRRSERLARQRSGAEAVRDVARSWLALF